MKKPRISSGKNSPSSIPEQQQQQSNGKSDALDAKAPSTAGDSPQPRRKSNLPDERQRSKRLFGALLGNLNPTGDRTTKRRAEIEQRRKAELKQQDDELLEDRQKRLERLAIQRRKRQIYVDEHDVRMASDLLRSSLIDLLCRCIRDIAIC